jgi:hypothetical protein
MRRLLMLLGVVAVSVGSTACGEAGSMPKPTLSVVTANMANAADHDGMTWKDRIDAFAAAITANAPAPDIISMTESAGLWHCAVAPYRQAEDYDLVDRLISKLNASLGVTYRVAYLTGASGQIKNPLGTPFCWYYSGDTLLYNPARLKNLTPDDVRGRVQVGHDDALIGFQIRRSLPLCSRGSNLEPLDQLIDGPPQMDRCNRQTPSGPAYAQVDRNRGGDETLVASLARFSLVDVPGSSFDVVTTHPMANEEEDHAETINSFISALTGAAYRAADPYWPVVVVGDYNTLIDQAWPRNTTQVARSDLMAAALGAGVGRQPTHSLSLTSATPLPNRNPCTGPQAVGEFSDHCGLLVRFAGN